MRIQAEHLFSLKLVKEAIDPKYINRASVKVGWVYGKSKWRRSSPEEGTSRAVSCFTIGEVCPRDRENGFRDNTSFKIWSRESGDFGSPPLHTEVQLSEEKREHHWKYMVEVFTAEDDLVGRPRSLETAIVVIAPDGRQMVFLPSDWDPRPSREGGSYDHRDLNALFEDDATPSRHASDAYLIERRLRTTNRPGMPSVQSNTVPT
ncbi:hypothetical protein JAAARDRAFT_201192 [Jaapia argillacea MUCL 33604]|uniref:Uncharacterized protein n=1 Tax=Jaapia argillacea MUCL 33604 TaxID=933084 RepID=A0A067P2S0_9AGAM|nr:hypothetical protein JAAARDRAFT_201192 [Jaapia argillacea MUCL 33604]